MIYTLLLINIRQDNPDMVTLKTVYKIHRFKNAGMKSYFKRERNKKSPLPLQGAITSSFLSRWSLWHLTWQRRHSNAGGGLKTCHRGLAQASQLEGKWYSVGMNSWPLCGRQLVLSPWRTGSMSASFLHSPSLAYRICRRTETHVSTPLSWTQLWCVIEY